jgi:hypothetical protein
MIAVTVIGVFALDNLRPLVRVALGWGILVNLEGLTMSLMLPRWEHDVKTLRRAWILRKRMMTV